MEERQRELGSCSRHIYLICELKEYLPLLLERGLLEYNEKDRVYSTTLRGAHFLEIYNEMSGILVHRKPL